MSDIEFPGAAMDAKAKRRVITAMLAMLQRDMDMAIEQMPDDWDETELGRRCCGTSSEHCG
jgi:hypothetical protein